MNRRSICTFTLALVGSLATGSAAPREDVAVRLAANPSLLARVQPLLPAGTSLQAAAAGFGDECEFLAALHVSRNLNIPFNELKANLTGTRHRNLTGALRALRPELRTSGINRHVKRATQQAKADLLQAGALAENTPGR